MSKILERLHQVDKKKDDAPAFLRPQMEKKELPAPRKKSAQWGIVLMMLGVTGIFASVYHLVEVQFRSVKPEVRKAKMPVDDFAPRYAALVKDIASRKDAKSFDASAEKLLREWSEDRPENTRLAVTLAYVLKRSGKLDEARRILEMVVVFDRDDALAWNNLGMVYAELHDYPKSISALQQSLALDKKEQVLLNLARVYEEADDFKSSQETLGRYLETFAPKDGLKATLKNRMRLLGSLAYLQNSSEPPSSAAPTISISPSASRLRGPASKGGN